MGYLAIMDRKAGDTRIEWDPANPEEVKVARRMFDDLRAKGYLTYKVTQEEGKDPSREAIKKFDPKAGKIVMGPPMAGGQDVAG